MRKHMTLCLTLFFLSMQFVQSAPVPKALKPTPEKLNKKIADLLFSKRHELLEKELSIQLKIYLLFNEDENSEKMSSDIEKSAKEESQKTNKFSMSLMNQGALATDVENFNLIVKVCSLSKDPRKIPEELKEKLSSTIQSISKKTNIDEVKLREYLNEQIADSIKNKESLHTIFRNAISEALLGTEEVNEDLDKGSELKKLLTQLKEVKEKMGELYDNVKTTEKELNNLEKEKKK